MIWLYSRTSLEARVAWGEQREQKKLFLRLAFSCSLEKSLEQQKGRDGGRDDVVDAVGQFFEAPKQFKLFSGFIDLQIFIVNSIFNAVWIEGSKAERDLLDGEVWLVWLDGKFDWFKQSSELELEVWSADGGIVVRAIHDGLKSQERVVLRGTGKSSQNPTRIQLSPERFYFAKPRLQPTFHIIRSSLPLIFPTIF